MSERKNPGTDQSRMVEKIVTVFLLAYGMHYFGYFIRARYFNYLETLAIDEGISHALGYLGHVVFIAVMAVYAWAVKKDRHYFMDAFRSPAKRNLFYGLLGALSGFGMMGLCILAAVLHGDLVMVPSLDKSIPVFLFGMFAVFVQASAEEFESRAFVFGRLKNEGVPLASAVMISAVFFSYLHAANPGFTLIPFLSIVSVGILYALSYHYFDTIWFTCAAHMMWNFTQDFIFGLPDSGKPAALSLFDTTVKGSGFFFDEVFGIEGSWMAILVNLLACLIVVLIGRHLQAKKQAERCGSSKS